MPTTPPNPSQLRMSEAIPHPIISLHDIHTENFTVLYLAAVWCENTVQHIYVACV